MGIYNNKFGYLVNEKMDGMDSAMRIGVILTFIKPDAMYGVAGLKKRIVRYVNEKGICLRCPAHEPEMPSCNPNNFTRDQMMCLVAGLKVSGEYGLVRKIFWATANRFFFAQNFERDMPGSKKYPWPHKFHKDSDPTKEVIVKWFDFADPLFPSHISHLITCGKMWYLYPFHILGWAMLAIQILTNSKKVDAEQNQLQCMIKSAGRPFVWLYKKWCKTWKEQTNFYWKTRNEREYAELIIQEL